MSKTRGSGEDGLCDSDGTRLANERLREYAKWYIPCRCRAGVSLAERGVAEHDAEFLRGLYENRRPDGSAEQGVWVRFKSGRRVEFTRDEWVQLCGHLLDRVL